MPTKTKLEITSFNRGLITEASPLTYPESASMVDRNFVLLKDGSRRRRLGLDYESGSTFYTILDTEGFEESLTTHIWKSPRKEGDFDIVVVQEGDRLRFFKSTGVPLSDFPLNTGGGVTLDLPVDYVEGTKIKTASLRGQMIVTYNTQQVLMFEYDDVSDVVSYKSYRITMRDLFGIETPFEVDERPLVLYPVIPGADTAINHLYNLRNQGWPYSVVTVKNAKGTEEAGSAVYDADPIVIPYIPDPTYFQMVSDADVMWRARVAAGESTESIGAYSPYELLKQNYGRTPAPKGKFVIDAFNRSATRQEQFNAVQLDTTLILPVEQSEGYVTNVASYAGRFFYSVKETATTGGDERSPKLSTMIFFSQVVNRDENVTACYAEADPTSEFIYDPIDTDGGFLIIPSAGEIIDMKPLGNSLFIFASNGVWEVHGGEQAFSATNQNLTKTTNIGAISSSSIVIAETSIIYWTDAGIYSITPEQASLRGIPANLSIKTIQGLYDSIHVDSRKDCIGVFDEQERKIRWIWKTRFFGVSGYGYNRELVFDIDLAAFYENWFASTPPQHKPFGVLSIPRLIYLSGSVSELDGLVYTFATYRNPLFLDFNIADAEAVLLTGALTGQTASTPKQIKNIVIHSDRTESGFSTNGEGGLDFDNPSGLTVTMQWEWTNSISAGRWSAPFQGYRLTVPYYPSGADDPFDYGYTVVTTKTGVRGKGRAISIQFTSQPLKDIHLLGWGLEVKVEDDF